MRWIVSDRTGWLIVGLSVLAVVSMFVDLALTIVLMAGCILILFSERYRLYARCAYLSIIFVITHSMSN